jgi:hypothetical protein
MHLIMIQNDRVTVVLENYGPIMLLQMLRIHNMKGCLQDR